MNMRSIGYVAFIVDILVTITCSIAPFDFDDIDLADYLEFNEFRNIDGSNNNEDNPLWGTASSAIERCVDADYGDGFNSITGETRISPRELSNVLASQIPEESDEFINNRSLTQFAWQWAQFINNDIVFVADNESEPINVYVPCCDKIFDPTCVCDADIFIDIYRSAKVEGTGSRRRNQRQQINHVTSFIDASMIYGSDEDRANELRTFRQGLLKTSQSDDGEDILPLNENGFSNQPDASSDYFLAGDIRANQQLGLLTLHTLFVRLHNIIAQDIITGIRRSNRNTLPQPDIDELTYQYAKLLVTAMIQKITYKDWLPTLFALPNIREYMGINYRRYDEDINPGICALFSSSAYRFDHTMLPQRLPLRNTNCRFEFDEDLELRDAFFSSSDLIEANGNDYFQAVVHGFSCTLCNEVDTRHTDAVRNYLYENVYDGNFDLVSIDIQRGRDHGLPDYNEVRRQLDLVPLDAFDDISSDEILNDQFEALFNDDYNDGINDIDVYLAGLAEDHLNVGSFGETISKIVLEQFGRLRDGDRFWYENYIKEGDLREWIDCITLMDIVAVTANIRNFRSLDEDENLFQNTEAISIFETFARQNGGKGAKRANQDVLSVIIDDDSWWDRKVDFVFSASQICVLLVFVLFIIGGLVYIAHKKMNGNDDFKYHKYKGEIDIN